MKKLFLLCLAIPNISFAQPNTGRQALPNTFRSNYNEYILAVSDILPDAKIDSVAMKIINKMMPKIADADAEGAVVKVSNILHGNNVFRVTTEFSDYIRAQSNNLIDVVAGNDRVIHEGVPLRPEGAVG